MQQEIRKTKDLEPHTEQGRIYGDLPDEDLIKSIEKVGILSPLVITREDVIVSGYRRWKVAQKMKMETVPVTIFPSDDDLDIKEAIVHFNKNRKKTKTILTREARALIEVNVARAARNKQATQFAGKDKDGKPKRSSDGGCQPPSEEKGRMREKVAEDLSISTHTVNDMQKIHKAQDKAEETGDTETLSKIEEVLDTKGYAPAVRLIEQLESEAEPEAAGPQEEVLDDDPKDIKDARNKLGIALAACKKTRHRITDEDRAYFRNCLKRLEE